MNRKRLIKLTICWILAAILGLPFLSFAGKESETTTKAEQHFEKAIELRKAADYDAAITEYKKAISLSPKSEIAQNAQYWIGQSYFKAEQFDAALSAFQKLLDEYPASTIIPSTKLMIERVQRAKKYYPLLEAIRKGDTEQVRLLISKGADVNAKDEEDKTPLHHAAEVGEIQVVQLLIKAGADLNIKDKDGESPADCARSNWHTDVVRLLVSKGADITLDLAAYLGDVAKVRNLIGSDPHVDESQLNRALHISLNGAHIDVAEFLLDKGANPNTTGKNNATILHSWAWGGNPDEAKLVIEFAISKGADVNALQGESRWTPLHSACSRGRGSVAKVLIDNGADVNAVTRGGRTPLHYAARNKDLGTASLLIAKGANVNAKGNRGRTSLHFAADSGNKDLTELLIAKGADVNAKDNDGKTPLHFAADSGNKDLTELLIAKGAKVNAKDNRGKTPLNVAANRGNKDIAELLIAKGADVYTKGVGWTPLHSACYRGRGRGSD